MGRLLLIEGIPGAGKTTTARRVADFLSTRGIPNRLYLEGQLHPADLGWCACLSPAELSGILAEYPAYAGAIRAHMTYAEDCAVVAYAAFPIEQADAALFDRFERHEVYDGRCSLTRFTALHRARWAAFGREAAKTDDVQIFECALLQNHVNELTLFHGQGGAEIIPHIAALLDAVRQLDPLIVYLRPVDARAAVAHVAAERGCDIHGQSWADRVAHYIADCPYGRACGLAGFDGMVSYFAERQRIELDILPSLPARNLVVDVDGGFDNAWAQVTRALEKFQPSRTG